MEIRHVVVDDFTNITQTEWDGAQPWTQQRLEAALRDKQALLLCAVDGESIAGLCDIHILYDTAHINELAVARGTNGKTAANMLLETAQTVAKTRACTKITIDVRSANRDAIRFYESCAFRKGEYKWGFYSNPSDDALVMGKTI